MVYTKSKESLRKSIDHLKQLGTITAIALIDNKITVLYHGGIVRVCYDNRIHSGNQETLDSLFNGWLNCQERLTLDGTISTHDLSLYFYFDRTEHGYPVFKAHNMLCHKDFEIFVTPEIEVHCEVI